VVAVKRNALGHSSGRHAWFMACRGRGLSLSFSFSFFFLLENERIDDDGRVNGELVA
jgi:hypothetical protein